MPSILKLTANVPTKVHIRYLDAVGGEYGPQARIKGRFTHANGQSEDAILYIAGAAPDAFAELHRAGVIASPVVELPAQKADKPVNVPTLVSDVVLLSELLAGEKYPRLRVSTNGGNGTPPAAQAAPQTFAQRLDATESFAPWEQKETGAPPANAAPAASQTAPRASYDNPLYLSIVQFVFGTVASELNGEFSAESLAAMVNTLFIAESRK